MMPISKSYLMIAISIVIITNFIFFQPKSYTEPDADCQSKVDRAVDVAMAQIGVLRKDIASLDAIVASLLQKSSSSTLTSEHGPPDGYDVIDIGSSNGGGSINFLGNAVNKVNFANAGTKEILDTRALGLDYDPVKVETCNKALEGSRNDCKLFDILMMTLQDLQDGTGERTLSGNSYWHVLEHIPNCDMAEEMWVKAATFSKRFSSFHGPAYDNELTKSDEKPTGEHRFWENWSGHKCHFNSTMMERAIRQTKKTTAFIIINYGKMVSTDNRIIVPKGTPSNSHHYDPKVHPAKKSRILDKPLYEEMRACAIYDDLDEEYLSLYSALCLKDAFQSAYELRDSEYSVESCSFGDNSKQSVEECTKLIKSKFVTTIRRFEEMNTRDIVQTI